MRPLEDRLAEKLEIGPGGCLIFTGTTNKKGYGTIVTYGGKKKGSHRVAYELYHDVEIPADLVIDHFRCDNPSCCNPFHLKVTTQKKNVHRSRHPSSIAHRKQQCQKGHPYSDENTWTDKLGKNHCRVCRRERREASKVC